MMNLRGLQRREQAGGAATATGGGEGGAFGPSSSSDGEKFTDIIFMEEPPKVKFVKNPNLFIERAKTNLDVLQSSSLNDSNEALKKKLIKQHHNETPLRFELSNSLVNRSPSSDFNSNDRIRAESSYFKLKPFQTPKFAPTGSDSVVAKPNNNNNKQSISPSVSSIGVYNLNSNSVDIIYNGIPSSSSMYLSKNQEQTGMTQYTKFSKTLFGDNAHQQQTSSRANQSQILRRQSNENLNKSPSRNSLNQQHESIFNSSSPLAGKKAGSGVLARSLTMKYVARPSYSMEGSNIPLHQQRPTNHFNFNGNHNLGVNRRSSFYHQPLESSPKRDLISSISPTVSDLKRSSSIKLNREKTSLSNYFSGLSSGVSGVGVGVTLNFLSSNTSVPKTAKKNQPVSLRNNLSRNKSLYNELPDPKPAHNSTSLENVMNGFELLLTDDGQVSKTANISNPGLKLVATNGGNLLSRSKRSEELLVVEPNSNPDDQVVEIKQINKSNNRQSVEMPDEVNSNEETKKQNLNRQRFNLINRHPSILLKKTKSFMAAGPNDDDNDKNQPPTTNQMTNSIYSKTSSSQNQNTGARVVRSNSRLSHVTRDVNDSYAYTNVQQYIEENDLMPPEKAYSIRKWIRQVNQNRDIWEKRTTEMNIVDS